MNKLIGSLRNTNWSRGGEPGQKFWASGLTSTELSAARTVVTTEANQIAVIDSINLHFPGSDASATHTITLTIGSQTLLFVARTLAGAVRQQHYTLRPKGTLIVPASTAFTIACSASSYAGNADVRYRLMSVTDAAAKGYLKQGTWACSTGNIAVAGTAQSITGFAASDVTANRYLEINGIAITGYMSNATSAANKTILLEFTDDSTTHRKVIKHCFASADPDITKPLIINNCAIRGPMGYGLRVTAGATGTACQIALWGKYGTAQVGGATAGVAPETFPGTGVIPGATDAFNAGKHFWVYSENTAQGVYEFFPSTTCAGKEDAFVIDGYAFSASGPAATGVVLSLANADLKSITGLMPLGVGGVGVGSAASFVDDEANILLRIKDRIGFGVGNLAGTAGALGMTAWGRFIGSPVNNRSASHLSRNHGGGT